MEYDSGTAILLVQEDEVPNHMRQAAIIENGAFVAGLKRYFDLVWEYESSGPRSRPLTDTIRHGRIPGDIPVEHARSLRTNHT